MADVAPAEASRISAKIANPEGDSQPNPNKPRLVEAQRLGRSLIRIVQDRDQQRLTPFLDPARFRRLGDTASLTTMDNPSEADVKRARIGSFSVALNAAHQIATADTRARGVREDPRSLSDVKAMIVAGITEGRELAATDRPEVVEAIKRNIAATEEAQRAGITPDKIKWSDEQILQWGVEQFNNAHTRLARSIQHLEDYSRR